MAQTVPSTARRLRAAIVLLSLKQFDRAAEALELSVAAQISDAFRAVVENVALEQGARFRIRSAAEIDLIFDASRSPSATALHAVMAAVQVLVRWRERELAGEPSQLSLPACSAAVHIDDFVSLGDTTLLGSGMEMARCLSAVISEEGVYTTERILDYILKKLPTGWNVEQGRSGLFSEPAFGMALSEDDLLPLSEEFEGRYVCIGPSVMDDSDRANLQFLYWREARIPGKLSQFNVLRVNGGVLPVQNCANDSSQQQKSWENRVGSNSVSEPIRFGRYELLGKLGEGGMGTVWLGVDRFGNKVAVKHLLAGSSVSASQLKRFQLEAEIMARLSHHNIARIYEVGEFDGATFIAMEYVEGASLAEVLASTGEKGSDLLTIVRSIRRDRPLNGSCANNSALPVAETRTATHAANIVLPIPQSLVLMQKICNAVQFAHEHGVLHRDLKPHNIMIRPDGEPVIMDFGLAKIQQGESNPALSLSLSGQIIGTLGYMAPEQAADSKHVSERADIYALGAILYELLTGHRAFIPSGDLGANVVRLQNHIITPIRKHNRLVERDLETIVFKALQPEPEQRYSSARLLADDLRRFAAGQPVLARKPTLRYRFARQVRKHRGAFAAVTIIATLLAVLGGYAWINYQKQWGKWVKVYERDFTQSSASLEEFEIRDPLGIYPTTAFTPERDGLPLEKFFHYWLKDVRVAGSVRVAAQVTIADPGGNFGVFINSVPGPLVWKTIDPRGYSGWLNYSGLDTISTQRNFAAANNFASIVPTHLVTGRTQHIVFEREHEKLTLSVNGKVVNEWVELLPLQGRGFDRIGFRSWGDNIRLRSLAVYRLALPESSSPIAAGDALLEAGHQEDAIHRYQAIAEDFKDRSIAPLALAKAYLTAIEIQSVPGVPSSVSRALHDTKKQIRDKIARDFPGFSYRHLLAEADALLHWNGPLEDKDKALTAVRDILREQPQSRIVTRMLSQPSSARVPQLLPWVARTQGLTALNLNGKNLDSMEGLRGAPLQALQAIQNRKITSIEPLRGMPLRFLEIDGHRFSDLEPLRGMPLESFRFGSSEVQDLSPLTGMPLKLLRLRNIKAKNFDQLRGLGLTLLHLEYMPTLDTLEFLRDMSVHDLSVRSCPVKDLGPLRRLPLVNVAFENCDISDLSPLATPSIYSLTCRGTRVVDISPLSKTQLRKLDISRNKIRSLDGVAGLPLRRLSCHTNLITSLEPLRGMQLESLDCQSNPLVSLAPFLESPPADFLFATSSLPEAEYERAIASWSRNPAWARNTRRAEIALALRRGNAATLRRLAFEFKGHRYLHVEQPMSWTKALGICEKVGGHLLSLTSREEADGVHQQGGCRGWLGITRKAGELHWQWLTGEPYEFQEWISAYSEPDNYMNSASISDDGRLWQSESPEFGAVRPFTIEWDN